MKGLFTDQGFSNNLSCSNVRKEKSNNHSVFQNSTK